MDSLNVSQFLTAYNASFLNEHELKVSTITGILEPRSDKIYRRGELYWELVDGGARLTVRMPARYRHLSGRRVEVTGQPTRQPRKDRGEIQVILDVEHMNPLDPTPEDWMGPLRLIGEQRQSSWPAIERSIESLIRAGDQPRVLMLYGVGSIVDQDVRTALGPYARAYSFDERQIPLTDPAAVAAALSGGNIDANLVAIVRGGGAMPALSDRQVINAVAYHMPVTIVSAVGHDVDQPLIQEVVHWAFATPTTLGNWLADRAKGAIQARDVVALDHMRALEAVQRQLTDLTEVVTAAKLAETAAREETGVLRLDLQKSESRGRTMRHMIAVLLVALVIVVVMLVWSVR